MAEWLILLLLVPVIVAPVVLVLGFAGCSFHPRPEPNIDSATGTSFNTISVAWAIDYGASARFQRTNLDNSVTDLGVQPTSPFTDTVPKPTASGQAYQYQGYNAIDSPPHTQPEKSATTFELSFDGMLVPQNDGSGVQGLTHVLRVEPAYPLTQSSGSVQLLLQASASIGASIDAIFISQADPNQPTQPWQPAGDLMQVPLPAQPLIVPPGGSVVALAPVAYALDKTKPLLIAVNYSAAPTSGIMFGNPVSISQAAVYFIQGAEAGLQTRSAGYTLASVGDASHSVVSLIANIYVFVG
jgi:hypothetical protein